MHYFKRNIGEYHKKAGKLSMLEHGAYTLLMDACYDRERFPTFDDAIDWCWARTPDELAAVDFILKKFFTLIDGLYIQNRIFEEIEQYHNNALINKEIALKREEKRRQVKARFVHEPTTNEHEVAPKQEPLTNKQEPLTNLKDLVPPKATPKKLSKRLSDDWKPTREYLEDALIIKPDLTQEWFVEVAHKFKDYWIAKSGKDATKADWLATWRNWVRREVENAKGRSGTVNKKSYGEQRAELFDGITDYAKATDF
jgi:uncharacterized protein YdaU (DUF1376 family)